MKRICLLILMILLCGCSAGQQVSTEPSAPTVVTQEPWDADGVLTDSELEYLPWGAKLMTLECGIRFLTDYLDGDHYFRIHYPEHNLYRCRTQFKLVSDMESQFDEMLAVVNKYR